MDLFPIKMQATGNPVAVLFVFVLSLVLNVALLYAVARVVATGVDHGLSDGLPWF